MIKSKKIYSGKLEDFHWVGFGSGSGTNLNECAKVISPSLIITDKPKSKLLKLEELSMTQHIIRNGYKFCGSWKKAKGNLELEKQYQQKSMEFNAMLLEEIKDFESKQGYTIDLIVLGGYMRFVTEPLLSAYKDKIINVHPSILSQLRGKRNYIGEDAVYDAIKDGAEFTRSSVIFVDGGEDNGEIITQGPIVKVWKEYFDGTNDEKKECLRKYVDGHQSLQKVRSDWPSLTTSLKMIANGRISIGETKDHFNKWRTVYLDGKALSYSGYQIK